MSYDLFLFLPVSGETPEATARRRTATLQTEVVNPGPPNAEAEARKEGLVRALLGQNPGLERFAFDLAEIARFEGITEEEARSQNRQVELNEPGDGPASRSSSTTIGSASHCRRVMAGRASRSSGLRCGATCGSSRLLASWSTTRSSRT